MESDTRLWTWTGIILFVIAAVSLFFAQTGPIAPFTGNHQCNNFAAQVSVESGEQIQEIIYTLSHTGTVSLLFKRSQLESLGAKLEGVVPALEFLGYIFSRPAMAKDMAIIRKSSLKYDNFVAGVQPNLLQDYQNGCLFSRGDAFAKYLSLPKQKIHDLLEQGVKEAETGRKKTAFKNFIDYLIDQKSN